MYALTLESGYPLSAWFFKKQIFNRGTKLAMFIFSHRNVLYICEFVEFDVDVYICIMFSFCEMLLKTLHILL